VEYSFSHLQSEIIELQSSFTSIGLKIIGHSVMGTPLYAIRLGSGPIAIFVSASTHANEWITTPMVMSIVAEFARADKDNMQLLGVNVVELLQQVALWIVPMVNPDGVELVQRGLINTHPYKDFLLNCNGSSQDFSQWKANIRGVDLNDQFPAYWLTERNRRSATGPAPRDFTGDTPLSEPEAVALAQFTKWGDFRMVMAFHTQGEEIYWNYRGLEPQESAYIAEQMARASGYRPVRLEDSDAGYKDWFIQEWRRPGFTIEMGRGVNPLPVTELPSLVQLGMRIMLVGLVASVQGNW
jgi:g-D-glutamyl-meso-diaminopimelate peptidase